MSARSGCGQRGMVALATVLLASCGGPAQVASSVTAEHSASMPSPQCVKGLEVAPLAQGFPKTPVSALPDALSLEQAYCVQGAFVHDLGARMGPPVGYKVGFTGEATQTRFGVAKPVTGVLLEKMFVADGATVAHDFAHRPLVEPDLMVVVKDASIMNAKTLLEVAAALESIHPCLELPALQLEKGAKVTGAKLAALNVAAVHMVMGPGVPVENSTAFVDAVGAMSTVFVDQDGKEVQRAPAANLMGHPFQVLLWLAKDFKGRGLTLKAGDRISLGSVGKLFPVAHVDQRYVYTLEGLPAGPARVTINFKGAPAVNPPPAVE